MVMKHDYNEQDIFNSNPAFLKALLIDHTTKKNIIWATNNYIRKGYFENKNIYYENLIGKNNPIKSRVFKSKIEQSKRAKDMAEVFTSSWVCNKQNNLIDEHWFGYKGAFNIEQGFGWITTEKVVFYNKSWKEYVEDIRLEITCGEAPYLVSRYDVVTGEKIELKNRIGLLDRKFRVVQENASNDEWLEYSLKALKSIYGYEYQGDNLLIARQNIFFTFIDNYLEKYSKLPDDSILFDVINIITWNIWQMDGIKMVVPLSCHEEEIVQLSLFDDKPAKGEFCRGCKEDNVLKHNGIRCIIMDWEKNKTIKFLSLMKGVI